VLHLGLFLFLLFYPVFISVSDHPIGEASGIGDQAGIACHGFIATPSEGDGSEDGDGFDISGGGYATCATGSPVGDTVAFIGSPALLVLIFADRVTAADGQIVVPWGVGDIMGETAGLVKFKSRSTTSDDRKIMTTARALRSIRTPTMHYSAGTYL
jgi:hypothetical protein